MISVLTGLFHKTGKLKKFILLLILRSPVEALMVILDAVFLRHSFSAILEKDTDRLILISILYLTGSALLFSYNGFVWQKFAAFVASYSGNLKRMIFHRISTHTQEEIDRRDEGEWLSLLNQDQNMTLALLLGPLTIFHSGVAFVSLFTCGFILCHQSPPLFLLSISFIIPHLIVNQLVSVKPIPKLKENSRSAVVRNTSDLIPIIDCYEIIQLYDAHALVLQQFEKSSHEIRHANLKIHFRSALSGGILPIFGLGCYMILLLVGGNMIMDGRMAFGDLTAALQYRGGLLRYALALMTCIINIQVNLVGAKHLVKEIPISLNE